VNYYGPVDLTAGYRDVPNPDPINSRDVLKSFLGGSPEERPELYQRASPIRYITAPMAHPLPPSLLIYGGRDHIVQSKYGRVLEQRLKSAGAQTALIEIPWADHAFDAVFNGVSNQLALYHTERFLAWALRARD
jgi:acetyl esterase/lipase